MPTFVFTARDSSGALSTGSIMADSIAAAVESLRSDGRYPTSVLPSVEAAQKKTWFLTQPRLSRKDLIQFVSQLQIMIETGVTLSEAMESIASQAQKPAVREVIGDLGRRISGGESLSASLARHPGSFPRILIALVSASEKSGLLNKMMGRAVAYLRDEQDTLRRVRGAMIYPAIMMAFALSTTTFLMTFVLPKFTAIYATKGATLPMATRVLMAVSQFMIHDWYWILIILATILISGWRYSKTTGGHRLFNYIQLRFPLIGPVFQKLHLSRGLRMIGTTASSGISLPDCVRTAKDLCPNIYYQDLWDEVARQIHAGKQFSEALFHSPLVPRSTAQMLHSAEKGGKLAVVMEQIAGFAEAELKERIVEMTRYIEPAMIVVMGAIIGTVALALMLPIFSISKVIAS